MATVETPGVLGTFHGSEEFPIDWQEGERELFWIYDDLHCPNPVSPLFFDIGGWWLTCDHMFRRFGTPFASDWIAKKINGYVYTAAIPADPSLRARGDRVPGPLRRRASRATASTPARSAPTSASCCPTTPSNFLDWWQDRLRPEIERNFAYLDGQRLGRRVVRRAGGPARGRDRRPRPPLEDPLDAQLRPVLGDDGPQRRGRGGARRGRARSSWAACRARSRTATGTRSRTSGR